MEGAGKLVEDDELRSAMADRGLGTPATRASVIEGLVDEEYLHRNGNEPKPPARRSCSSPCCAAWASKN